MRRVQHPMHRVYRRAASPEKSGCDGRSVRCCWPRWYSAGHSRSWSGCSGIRRDPISDIYSRRGVMLTSLAPRDPLLRPVMLREFTVHSTGVQEAGVRKFLVDPEILADPVPCGESTTTHSYSTPRLVTSRGAAATARSSRNCSCAIASLIHRYKSPC